MSDLLLPCPFCGQKAYIRKRHHSMPRDPTYQAYCDDCGCGTSDLYRQPALAIQAWNQRALADYGPERQLAELQEIATERHALIAGPMARSSKLVGERYDAMKARIAELEAERDRLLAENDAFRARTGNSHEPCIYCGLSAEDQLKCQNGFPGCARADDQMLCRHFAAELEVLDRAIAAEKRITEIEGEIFPHHQELLHRARLLEARIEKTEAERDAATRALKELFAFVWDHVRTGSQVDSFDAQHKLAELGLIRLEPVRTADEEIEWGQAELWYPTALVENQESGT